MGPGDGGGDGDGGEGEGGIPGQSILPVLVSESHVATTPDSNDRDHRDPLATGGP